MDTVLRVFDLTKTYRSGSNVITAVDHISMSIDGGEMVAVTGPSGSGKTTLLSLVGGLEVPTSGEVWFGDMNLNHLSPGEMAGLRRRDMGFIFQGFHLLRHLTALENVLLPLGFSGLSGRAQRARARELLDLVGLDHRVDHFPRQLSGGEQQRVAIARALANEPALLLADEPTGNLDEDSTLMVFDLLERLNQKLGQTAMIVSHDPVVRDYAGRVLYMRGGRLGGQGA